MITKANYICFGTEGQRKDVTVLGKENRPKQVKRR
jgi:hypothetical protein